MTPEEGYRLAQYQRPGVQIVMGPTEAREEPVRPLTDMDYSKLPGDCSLFDYDVRRVCGGWLPHRLAIFAGGMIWVATGRLLTVHEWRYLHDATAEARRAFVHDALYGDTE